MFYPSEIKVSSPKRKFTPLDEKKFKGTIEIPLQEPIEASQILKISWSTPLLQILKKRCSLRRA